MASGGFLDTTSSVAFTDSLLRALAQATTRAGLAGLMEDLTGDLGFRYFALVHHDDLSGSPAGRVDIKRYPAAVTERIVHRGMWRRDPVMRGCIFSDAAFVWSRLPEIIRFDRRDREALALGAKEGLNQG